ncbi:PAS domain S-box-containing protein [Pedobacter sp. CAN_A7]|uniref:PAS domain-containing sensor histidine kinase n=1 Tax=Pedobacter sp. CAN_A7 TaxID=2787722 RepID=UPI0018C8F7CB
MPESSDHASIINSTSPDESEELNHQSIFKHFFYESPFASYSCNKEGYVTVFNQAAVELWGRTPEIGKDLYCGSWRIYHPDGKQMQLSDSPMALALKEGRAYDNFLITIERPDRTIKNVMLYARPIFDKNKCQIGTHSILVDVTNMDVTDKKQAILSAIVESTDNAIISKNLDGKVTSWNPGAQQIFGYTESEMVGQSILKIIPADRQTEEIEILDRLKKGERIEHLQTMRLTKSGKEVPISLTISPVRDSWGIIIGASKIARDITEELRIQKAIKKNTQNLEILNALGKVILEKLDVKAVLQKVTDATTKITGAEFGAFFYNAVNEEGENLRLFSISGTEIDSFEKLGMPMNTQLFDLTFKDKQVVRSANIASDARYGSNGPHHGIPVGHMPVASYMAVPVISTSGEVIGSLLFGHRQENVFTTEHEDIIGSVASQAAVALENSTLFEGIKVLSAKKDEFIALASHELKTPITSIKGYLQISARTEKDELGRKFIGKALAQVDKLDSLVTDLLDSSKIVAGKIQFNLAHFDLYTLLLDVIDTFKYANKTHEIIVMDSQCDYMVFADQQRIEQVLINLLSNAVKYSPKADKVYVSTTSAQGSVTISIRDEGMGISETQKHLIFTRFYRADGPSNISGLGLGLYLTKEIIERHHGSIHVKSVLGKGSNFYFSLPLAKVD